MSTNLSMIACSVSMFRNPYLGFFDYTHGRHIQKFLYVKVTVFLINIFLEISLGIILNLLFRHPTESHGVA